MYTDFKKVIPTIISYILKVSIAGLVIGLLYKQEVLLTIILAAVLIFKTIKVSKDPSANLKLQIAGMVITGVLGVIIEYIGTSLGYWEYHNIAGQLPKYLLIVWMFAFMFMYNIEKKVFSIIKDTSIKKRLFFVIFIVVLYPTIGEIICINFGVWTYYYPYIFLGVSPYTITYIALVHLIINFCISTYLKHKNIKDIVLNP